MKTSPLKIIPEFESLEQLNKKLTIAGCQRCDLGFQPGLNGVCVSRGTTDTNKMIVGEAPGRYEDSRSKPFVGPAGKLLDKIWAAADMSTEDWYITNTVLCRPIGAKGSGKENYTPKTEQRKRCSPFLEAQICLLKPKIIVTLGRVATEAVCGVKGIRMGDHRGMFLENMPKAHGAIVFPMLHPAAILHASREPAKEKEYKMQTWANVQKLRDYIKKENI
jgi:uracil-DNA glycosylase family 4